MDETRAAREIYVPFAVPNILPETQLELEGQAALSDTSAQSPGRLPGDVLDGSVDYYDFDWGQEAAHQEETIFSGCRQNDTSYAGCGQEPPCSGGHSPGTPEGPDVPDDVCPPQVRELIQGDDPGYATVEP